MRKSSERRYEKQCAWFSDGEKWRHLWADKRSDTMKFEL